MLKKIDGRKLAQASSLAAINNFNLDTRSISNAFDDKDSKANRQDLNNSAQHKKNILVSANHASLRR